MLRWAQDESHRFVSEFLLSPGAKGAGDFAEMDRSPGKSAREVFGLLRDFLVIYKRELSTIRARERRGRLAHTPSHRHRRRRRIRTKTPTLTKPANKLILNNRVIHQFGLKRSNSFHTGVRGFAPYSRRFYRGAASLDEAKACDRGGATASLRGDRHERRHKTSSQTSKRGALNSDGSGADQGHGSRLSFSRDLGSKLRITSSSGSLPDYVIPEDQEEIVQVPRSPAEKSLHTCPRGTISSKNLASHPNKRIAEVEDTTVAAGTTATDIGLSTGITENCANSVPLPLSEPKGGENFIHTSIAPKDTKLGPPVPVDLVSKERRQPPIALNYSWTEHRMREDGKGMRDETGHQEDDNIENKRREQAIRDRALASEARRQLLLFTQASSTDSMF
eukprot:CAMPEP_0184504160 /NCGR_PEP_ID=MMETSP0113_2-20130426/52314_1 /TAXON_ID=91329 /ORGANISM="Norrisiella sphaerica, Strain BC52" /LENGTH=390 /DNA_ID=CAMNT_0026893779 /DNA_START=850 /DNA_END=2022 /DNA_ORIENTATION=-